MRLLIITYYWPPSSGSGVQRWMYFAKYLHEFGIEPIVLTVKPEKASYRYIDESLNKEVEHVTVYRTSTREPLKLYSFLRSGSSRKAIPHGHVGNRKGLVSWLGNVVRSNFYVPDARIGWNRFALREARRILAAKPVDALITTGTPHSTHLIGLQLKKETGIKWLADFRDPWSELYYNKELKRLPFASRRDARLERQVLDAADMVLSVGPSLSRLLAGKVAARDKFRFILNGYDEEKMASLTRHPGPKFAMTFIGLLTMHQPFHAIVDALRKVAERKSDFAHRSQLVFAGTIEDEVLALARSIPGVEMIHHGRVSHRRSLELMMNASLLLNCLPETEESKLFITGKMMEYLATGNPVLSTGPVDGDAAALLKETANGRMFPAADVEGMADFVNVAFGKWASGESFLNENRDRFSRYSRRETTRELAGILRNL